MDCPYGQIFLFSELSTLVSGLNYESFAEYKDTEQK